MIECKKKLDANLCLKIILIPVLQLLGHLSAKSSNSDARHLMFKFFFTAPTVIPTELKAELVRPSSDTIKISWKASVAKLFYFSICPVSQHLLSFDTLCPRTFTDKFISSRCSVQFVTGAY